MTSEERQKQDNKLTLEAIRGLEYIGFQHLPVVFGERLGTMDSWEISEIIFTDPKYRATVLNELQAFHVYLGMPFPVVPVHLNQDQIRTFLQNAKLAEEKAKQNSVKNDLRLFLSRISENVVSHMNNVVETVPALKPRLQQLVKMVQKPLQLAIGMLPKTEEVKITSEFVFSLRIHKTVVRELLNAMIEGRFSVRLRNVYESWEKAAKRRVAEVNKILQDLGYKAVPFEKLSREHIARLLEEQEEVTDIGLQLVEAQNINSRFQQTMSIDWSLELAEFESFVELDELEE